MPRELFANPLTDGSQSPWLDVAEAAGSVLRQDIVSRDASGEAPRYALEILRNCDLLNLVIPRELGGAGEPWSTAAEVTRIIARADAGIAHALGYHYTWLWFVSAYDTEPGRAVLRRTATGNLFWASIGSAFGGTGSIRAGQRLSASTGITLTDVRIGRDSIIAVLSAPDQAPTPLQSLMIPTFQLLFAYLNLGIAEGALLEARDYVHEHGRPWVHSPAGRSSDDPFVVNLFGEKAARVGRTCSTVPCQSRPYTADPHHPTRRSPTPIPRYFIHRHAQPRTGNQP